MDRIEYEILEDGTISIKTNKVSAVNHQSADDLLDMLEELTGGTREIKSLKEHVHTHEHIYVHSHGHVHQ